MKITIKPWLGGVFSLLGGLLAGILCIIGFIIVSEILISLYASYLLISRYLSFLIKILIIGIVLGFIIAGIGGGNTLTKKTPKKVLGGIVLAIAALVNVLGAISLIMGDVIGLAEGEYNFPTALSIIHIMLIAPFTLGLIGGIFSIVTARQEK